MSELRPEDLKISKLDPSWVKYIVRVEEDLRVARGERDAYLQRLDEVNVERQKNEVRALIAEARAADLEGALRLVAAPKRPDGTYNRSREACEELARKVLDDE